MDLIPDVISAPVPTYIYISTDDDSVYSLDQVNSSEAFVTENPDLFLDGYNPLAEDLKIHCITSKYLDTTASSTTEERHNADIISAQLGIGVKDSCTNLKYIIHYYKPYTSNFLCPSRLTVPLDTSESTLPEGKGYLLVPSLTTQVYLDIKTYYYP